MLKVRGRLWPVLVLALVSVSFAALAACGGEVAATPAPVIQTVVVEKIVQQTVVVEKLVDKIVQQTVVVVVEKSVDKIVQQTVVVVATAAATATAAPTVSPTKAPIAQRGTAVIGITNLNALVQLPEKDANATAWLGTRWEIYEGLLRIPEPWTGSTQAPFEKYAGGVAESWVVAPDLKKITFKIRKGIQFHGGYGELTAKDVAFTVNSALKEGTVAKFRDSLPPGQRIPFEIIDDYTVVSNVKEGGFDILWPFAFDNGGPNGHAVVSKKAYDEMGPDKFNVTPIGTGPFKVLSWKAQDEVVTEALPTHWRVVPKVKTVRYVAVPEQATREAALKTGQIHITVMSNKVIGRVLAATGSRSVQIGQPRPQVIYFAGNYWGTNCPTCVPTNLSPRPGFKPDSDHPWIGDPKNPERMESARKVRWAMAMAIDRQQIVDTVMRGFGSVIYTHTNVSPDDPLHKPEWVIPFDPKKAKEFLKDAGYPAGFKVTFWMTQDVPQAWDPELGDAVGEMWRQNLGLNVTIEKAVYAARRPTTVDKTVDIPFMHGVNYRDLLQSAGIFQCASPGHIGGVEMEDKICATVFANQTEVNVGKRVQNNILVQDYMSQWMVNSPVARLSTYFVARSEVLEWEPYQTTQEEFNAPHTIVMK